MKMGELQQVQAQYDKAEVNTGSVLARLTEESLASGPIVTEAGIRPVPKDGRPAKPYLGDNLELLEKTAHVRRKGETLGQFFSRGGCGKAQILAWSPAQIAAYMKVVEENAKNDPVLVPHSFRPPIPKSILTRFLK
jgi:hypothetical protein